LDYGLIDFIDSFSIQILVKFLFFVLKSVFQVHELSDEPFVAGEYFGDF